MTEQELEVALDRYGGRLDRWPAALRAEAEALAAESKRASQAIASSAQLETTLAAAMAPMNVDSAFLGRIMAHAGETPHHEVAVRATPRFVAWASAAMVAFLATGYAVGATLPDVTTQDDDAPLAGLLIGSDTGDSTTGVVALDSGSLM
ncbi:MAG TPA: hypothetical protein VG894_07975 [Bauldia sp.]|nr:hypothetical protein [Bauldia sp.]